MNYVVINPTRHNEIKTLFQRAFADAASEEEGTLVGTLADELALAIDDQNILCFATQHGEQLRAAIFFTRLFFDEPVSVFMLAPVAVHSAHQRQGIGQKLIHHGLAQLRARSVDIITTYGDPAFYSQLGFLPLSEQTLQAPLPLSMPFGWQGLSLTDVLIPTLRDKPQCVAPFNNPVYW